MRTIPYRKALALGCALVHALSWAFVLVHLLSILPGAGFDPSGLVDGPPAHQPSLAFRLAAESPGRGDGRIVDEERAGSCHDRDHCGICSFAGAKVLSWPSPCAHGVAAMGAVASPAWKPPPLPCAIAGSIRAPPSSRHSS